MFAFSFPTIEQEAFIYCTSLTNVTIPLRVVTIGLAEFYNCSKLTSVTIGSGVTEIGVRAFDECKALTNIYCKPTIPPAIDCLINDEYDHSYNHGSFPFNSGLTIYVPSNSYNAYMQYNTHNNNMVAQINWYGYKSYIEPYNF